MALNDENRQMTTEVIEKEDRPLKRKVDRQAQKILELTTQISKLEAEAEKQAEELGSLQDERDDAQDATKKALYDLGRWRGYAISHNNFERTQNTRLTKALNVSQQEVIRLQEENRLREQTTRTDGKKLCDALSAVYGARRSEDAALQCLWTLVKETGAYEVIAPGQSMSPTVHAVPLIEAPTLQDGDGSDSDGPALSSSSSKSTPPRRQYTIEEMKEWSPVAMTQRKHGSEVAAAIWKCHPHHKRNIENRLPNRPFTGIGGTAHSKMSTGMPTSSFAPSLDTETRQLTQALANVSSPLAAAARARAKAEYLARLSPSSPVIADGSTS
ncbi:MAG: hypothetical protein LQ346_005684 [Caloplaca aetnensis]|nr:MAG: hypothetical protein LQ346_005684 [Caloplaca aetnensis]